MKLDSKGIGWLIAGVVICASSFPGTGAGDMISTILIGLTFIAVYVMKQKFKPVGLGWFIAGGIFFAFTVDIVFEAAAGLFSRGSDDAGLLSSIMIGGALSFFFMLMFYHKNREVLQDVANSADYSESGNGEFEFPYQEKVFKEETVEVVNETAEADDVNAAPDTDDEFIEIEVTDEDGK